MGINLEDRDKESQRMYPAEVAAERIRRALATAKATGVPDDQYSYGHPCSRR